ncbi:hypothetical protein [Dendronalium sp. ChiSLP03b]|uniref:hypothetical protein n=1 Tax=Dendronalium sp. ChiSLP03b TaxID=3075381 RepID=UPI002AD2E02F|nr:hypothetical protein [Dendronalium sp. ChiSLP03b]MDZ8205258.1 hypothetical protein [Dendronalium sp. ChiSLP03b]
MSDKSNLQNLLLDEVLAYYERGLEVERLSKRTNPIELVRTQELLSRYLPQKDQANSYKILRNIGVNQVAAKDSYKPFAGWRLNLLH